MSSSSDVRRDEIKRRLLKVGRTAWLRLYVLSVVLMVVFGFALNQIGNPMVPSGQHPDPLATMGGLFGALALFYAVGLVLVLVVSVWLQIRAAKSSHEW